MKSPRSSRGRLALISALAGLMLAVLAPGTMAAATRPITFTLELGTPCIGGRASDNQSLTVAWRDRTGALKAKATVETSDWGSWGFCADGQALEIGDVIRATDGSRSHRLAIPRLTLVADRANDVYHGRAPAGTAVRLWYTNGLYSDYNSFKKVTADGDGRWSFAAGIYGGFSAELRWRDGHGDVVSLVGSAPSITLRLGSARFGVNWFSRVHDGATIELRLEDSITSEDKATGTATADHIGSFVGRFRNDQGDSVAVARGDRLRAPSVAADADWIVPDIEGAANVRTDRVRGRCLDAGTSERFAEVHVFRSGAQRGFALAGADENGYFVADFSDSDRPWFNAANIKHGDRIVIRCLQTTGDWVERSFRVP